MVWGAIVVSLVNGIAFVAAIVMAFMKTDQTNMNLLVGAIIAMMTSTSTFWVGGHAIATANRQAMMMARREDHK